MTGVQTCALPISANQFARMKYGNDALNLLDGIKSGLAYSENRPVMDAYVGEMTRNIRDTISPKDPEDYSNPIAGAIKQFTFLWYLTSPASAIVNFASLPVFAVPVLQTRFKQSAPETWATVMGNAKKVLSLTGVKNKEGKFTAPTMYNSLKEIGRAHV